MPAGIFFQHRIIVSDLNNPAQIGTILFVLQVNEEIFDGLTCTRFVYREIPALLQYFFQHAPSGWVHYVGSIIDKFSHGIEDPDSFDVLVS